MNELISSWAMESDSEKAFVLHNVSADPVNVPAEYDLPGVFTTYSGTTITPGGQLAIPPFCTVVLAGGK